MPVFMDRHLYRGMGRRTIRRGRLSVHDAFDQAQQVRTSYRIQYVIYYVYA